MSSYISRKLLLAIPTILIVATLVFFAMRIVPGDPAIAALGADASEASLELFRTRMGLDRPMSQQYFDFISRLVRGDLGRSLTNNIPINQTLRHILPLTLELTFTGLFIGVILGIPLGVLAAIRRNSFVDYVNRVISLAGLSVPAFVLAIILILVFSIRLGWFPVAGSGDIRNFADRLHRLFLPALNIGLIMTGYITRMTRGSVLEKLKQDYIRTARSKGLHERSVLFKHMLKNAMIPIVTIIGINASMLIGSSVITEIIFNRPGIGSFIVRAMRQRDYVTIQSLVIVFTVFVVLINLITDIIYGFIDPRIRYE